MTFVIVPLMSKLAQYLKIHAERELLVNNIRFSILWTHNMTQGLNWGLRKLPIVLTDILQLLYLIHAMEDVLYCGISDIFIYQYQQEAG